MDLIEHIVNQREFSFNTFGPGNKTAATIDHIRKELLKIEAEPLDLEEWIDVILSAIDGACRTGYSPIMIVQCLEDKFEKNKTRKYPDWRTADLNKAIEHIRE